MECFNYPPHGTAGDVGRTECYINAKRNCCFLLCRRRCCWFFSSVLSNWNESSQSRFNEMKSTLELWGSCDYDSSATIYSRNPVLRVALAVALTQSDAFALFCYLSAFGSAGFSIVLDAFPNMIRLAFCIILFFGIREQHQRVAKKAVLISVFFSFLCVWFVRCIYIFMRWTRWAIASICAYTTFIRRSFYANRAVVRAQTHTLIFMKLIFLNNLTQNLLKHCFRFLFAQFALLEIVVVANNHKNI